MSDMSKPGALGALGGGGQVGYGAAAGAGGLNAYLGVHTPPASAPSLHSGSTQPSTRNGASTSGQDDSDPYKTAMSAGRAGSASTLSSSAAQGGQQQPLQSSQPQQVGGQTQQHPGHHPQGFPSYGYNSGAYGNAGAQGGGGLGGNGSGGWDAYGYGGRQGGGGGYWG